MQITSKEANKMIKRLEDDKAFILAKENDTYFYKKTEGEEFEVPEYDFIKTENELRAIDDKIMLLKNAINVSNVTSNLPEPHANLTVDMALVKMAQLNRRIGTLNAFRRTPKKERLGFGGMFGRTTSSEVEYKYANFDPEEAATAYEKTMDEIMELQSGIDFVNQTVRFTVDL